MQPHSLAVRKKPTPAQLKEIMERPEFAASLETLAEAIYQKGQGTVERLRAERDEREPLNVLNARRMDNQEGFIVATAQRLDRLEVRVEELEARLEKRKRGRRTSL